METAIDTSNVIEWNGRPKRTRKPPPKTYWEEFVNTDEWYIKKLVEDIPPDEMFAAFDDEDLEDAGEEGDSEMDSEEQDSDFEDIVESDDIPSSDDDGADTDSDSSGSCSGATD
jgi:hypothetical protein